MSREIKFRAKVADSDYENEKQSETIGSFVHFTGFIGSENDIGYVEQLEEIHGVGWFDVDLKTLGQYTGLKDKNGKEIYEGDIVNNTRGYQDKLMLVKWSEAIEEISSSGCEWTRQNPGFVFENISKGMTYVFIANKDLEVIGNIYENPELLEETA